MTVLNLQIGQNADDAVEMSSDGSVFVSGGLDFGSLFVGRHIGLRWQGVSGLSGSTINSAVLTFRSKSEADSGSFVGDWYAHDTAAPAEFSDAINTDISGRTRTTTTCEGDGSDFGNWTGGQDQTFTGDGTNTIADIIQELANSYDPSAIVLVHIYASGSGERRAWSYDTNSPVAPKLDITFTAGGPSIVTGQVDFAGVGSLTPIGGVTLPASATFSGVGALVAAGTIGVIHEGAAVLSGVGTLTLGTPVRTLVGQSSILGEGSLVAVGERGALAAAVLGGVGTMSVFGEVGLEGRAALAGVGSLSVLAQRIVPGTVVLSGVGSLDVAGSPTLVGAATLSGVGTLAIIGETGDVLFTIFGGVLREIDPDDYPTDTVFTFEATLAGPSGGTARARLYNITDAAAVADSDVATANPEATRRESGALTLPSGPKLYRAEYGGVTGQVYTIFAAALRVESN